MNGAKVRAWLQHQQVSKGWMLSPSPNAPRTFLCLARPAWEQGPGIYFYTKALWKVGSLAFPGTYQEGRLIAPHRFGELGVWGRVQSFVLTSSGGGLLQFKVKPSTCHLLQEDTVGAHMFCRPL